MESNFTMHARNRCKQRGIPPFIISLLKEFGEEAFDGNGAIKRYFSKNSKRLMCKELGRQIVVCLKQYLNTYMVESIDGAVITTGWISKRIKR